jgi:hypothetical protein
MAGYHPHGTWAIKKLLVGLAILWLTSSASAEDIAANFRAQTNKILADLQSGNLKVQLQAIELLKAYPTPDAAEMVIQNLDKLAAAGPQCCALLRGFIDDVEVGTAMHAALVKEVRSKRITMQTYARALILLSADEPQVTKLVDEFLLQGEKNLLHVRVMIGAVDLMGPNSGYRDLGGWNGSFDYKPLHRLADSSLGQHHTGLKRAIIQCASLAKPAESVELLIKILPHAEGEGKNDIHRYLHYHCEIPTEQKTDWIAWWNENKATYLGSKMPDRPRLRPADVQAGQATLATIPPTGSRIVFIADYTVPGPGSTAKSPLAVQRELIDAVALVPDGAHFNVMLNNPGLTPWKREPQLSSLKTRKEATRFIQTAQAAGTVYPIAKPIELALTQNADAIYYFYNTAQPTVGIREEAAYFKEASTKIFELNRMQRASIHAIVFSQRDAHGFLSTTSQFNFGKFLSLP